MKKFTFFLIILSFLGLSAWGQNTYMWAGGFTAPKNMQWNNPQNWILVNDISGAEIANPASTYPGAGATTGANVIIPAAGANHQIVVSEVLNLGVLDIRTPATINFNSNSLTVVDIIVNFNDISQFAFTNTTVTVTGTLELYNVLQLTTATITTKNLKIGQNTGSNPNRAGVNGGTLTMGGATVVTNPNSPGNGVTINPVTSDIGNIDTGNRNVTITVDPNAPNINIGNISSNNNVTVNAGNGNNNVTINDIDAGGNITVNVPNGTVTVPPGIPGFDYNTPGIVTSAGDPSSPGTPAANQHIMYSPNNPYPGDTAYFFINSSSDPRTTITAPAGRNVYIRNVGAHTGALTVTVTGAGFIEIHGAYSSNAALTLISGAGGVRFNNSGSTTYEVTGIFTVTGTMNIIGDHTSIRAQSINTGAITGTFNNSLRLNLSSGSGSTSIGTVTEIGPLAFGGPGTATTNGNITVGSFTVDNGVTFTLPAASTLTVSDTITVSTGGTINSAGNITFSGAAWSIAGTFNPTGGTVTFSGTSPKTVSGNNTFNNVSVAANVTVNFANGSNQAVTGNLNLAAGSVIRAVTSGAGQTRWNLTSGTIVPAAASSTIADCNSTPIHTFTAAQATDGGNNVNVFAITVQANMHIVYGTSQPADLTGAEYQFINSNNPTVPATIAPSAGRNIFIVGVTTGINTTSNLTFTTNGAATYIEFRGSFTSSGTLALTAGTTGGVRLNNATINLGTNPFTLTSGTVVTLTGTGAANTISASVITIDGGNNTTNVIVGNNNNLTLNGSALLGSATGIGNLAINGNNSRLGASGLQPAQIASIRAASVVVSGTVEMRGHVEGNQTYNGLVTFASGTETGADGAVRRLGLTGQTVTFNGGIIGGLTTGCQVIILGNAVFNSGSFTTAPLMRRLQVDGTTIINANISTQAPATNPVAADGNMTFTGAVTLGANVTLSAPAAVDRTILFGSTVDSDNNATPRSLTIVNASVTFNGVVGGNNPLLTITDTTAATPARTTAINANITTTENQTYNRPVTLGGTPAATARIFTGGGAGTSTITFNNTVTGSAAARPLAIFNANVIFNGTVGTLASINVTGTPTAGTTTINTATITTSGVAGQNYSGNVVLGINTTLNAGTANPVVIGSASGRLSGAHNLTITGAATLNGTSSRIDALTLNQTGIFQTADLQAAIVIVTQTSNIGVNINTTSNQTYTGAVTLAAGTGNITLSSEAAASMIMFSGTLNGARDLFITNANATFTGAVGQTAALTSLSVAGTSAINGNVRTTGNQTYTGAVTLGGTPPATARIFTGGGAGVSVITFNGTVAGSANTRPLEINNADVIFNNTVGTLASINVTGTPTAGTTTINTATITTSGAAGQDYGGNVLLGNNVTFAAGAAANTVRFGGKINSTLSSAPRRITINPSGVRFDGDVGDADDIISVEVYGAAAINANITTIGSRDFSTNDTDNRRTTGQDYRAAVTIFRNVTLTAKDLHLPEPATGRYVYIRTTLNGAFSITFEGNARFGGIVGTNDTSANRPSSITVNGRTRKSAANSSINTNGPQSYNGDVIFEASPITFNAGNLANTVLFNSAVRSYDATARAFIITNSRVVFNGNVGGAGNPISTVTVNTSGSAVINANITTTGAQTYNVGTIIQGNRNLVSSGAGAAGTISFTNTVNSIDSASAGLTVNAVNINFTGAVGGTHPLENLSATGAITIGAGVRTDINQTYTGNITLNGSNRTFQSITGTITSTGAFNAANGDFTITANNIVLGGATVTLGALTLESLTHIAINGNITAQHIIMNANKTSGVINAANGLTIHATSGTAISPAVCPGSIPAHPIVMHMEAFNFIVPASGSIIPGTEPGSLGELCLDIETDITIPNNYVSGNRYHTHKFNPNAHLIYLSAGSVSVPAEFAGLNPRNIFTASSNITSFSVNAGFNIYIHEVGANTNDVTFETALTGAGFIEVRGSYIAEDLTLNARNGDLRLKDAHIEILGAGNSFNSTANTTTLNGTSGSSITAPSVSTGTVVGGNNNLTLNASSGAVIIAGTGMTGINDLIVNHTGTTSINLNANIYATGVINLNRPITLGMSIMIVTQPDMPITLGAITGNNFDLNIGNSGAGPAAITFNGATGLGNLIISRHAIFNTAPITAATVHVTGTSNINADITTTNHDTIHNEANTTQMYRSDVILGANVTLTGPSIRNIRIDGTTNGTAAGIQSLTINTANVTFDNSVGTSVPLAALTTNGNATVMGPAAEIRTSGSQNYNSNLTINAASAHTFVSTTGSISVTGIVSRPVTTAPVTMQASQGITLNGANTIETTGTAVVTLSNNQGTATGNISFNNTSSSLTVSAVNTSTAGTISITQNGALILGNVSANANINITRNGTGAAITQVASSAITTPAVLSVTSASAVTLNNANNVHTLAVPALGGAIQFNNNAHLRTGIIMAGANNISLTTTTGNNITQNSGTFIVTTGELLLNSGGVININETLNAVSLLGIGGAGGIVEFNSAVSNLDVRSINNTGNNAVKITNDGTITVTAIVNMGGELDLSVEDGNDITITADIICHLLRLYAPGGIVTINPAVNLTANGTQNCAYHPNCLNQVAIFINADQLIAPQGSGQINTAPNTGFLGLYYVSNGISDIGALTPGSGTRLIGGRFCSHGGLGSIPTDRHLVFASNLVNDPVNWPDTQYFIINANDSMGPNTFHAGTNFNIYIVNVDTIHHHLTFNAGTGFIELRGNNDLSDYDVTINSPNPVRLNNTATTFHNNFTGPLSAPRAVTIDNSGAVLVTNSITAPNINLGAVTADGSGTVNNLTLTASSDGGSVTFAGVIGANVINNLIVNTTAGASTSNTVNINADITAEGSQVFASPITLGAAVTLTAGAASGISLGAITGGNNALTIENGAGVVTGNVVFTGVSGAGNIVIGRNAVFNTLPVTALSLSVHGTAAINVNVTTTAASGNGQLYQSDVTLAGAGDTRTLTGNAGSTIRFEGNILGAKELVIAGANAHFDGTIGVEAAPLMSLSVAGTSRINADIFTSGSQNYTGAVTLGGSITLTGSGATNSTVNFAGAVTGNANTDLLVVNRANVNFMGGANGLSSITVGPLSQAGTTAIHSPLTTVGSTSSDGIYLYGSVVLGVSTTLTVHPASPVMLGLITGAGFNLTINNGAGTGDEKVTFTGANALGALIVNKNAVFNTSAINANTVAVTAASAEINTNIFTAAVFGNAQNYNASVLLGANVNLTGAGGSTILFGGAVNGEFDLTITNAHVDFTGLTGAIEPLRSITVTGSPSIGNALINNDISTANNQVYNGNVIFSGAGTTRTLTSSGGSISALGVVSRTGTPNVLAINTLQGMAFINPANTFSGVLILNNNQTGTRTGSVSFVTTAAITVGGTNPAAGTSPNGNFNITAGGNIIISGIQAAGDISVTSNGGNIDVAAAINSSKDVSLVSVSNNINVDHAISAFRIDIHADANGGIVFIGAVVTAVSEGDGCDNGAAISIRSDMFRGNAAGVFNPGVSTGQVCVHWQTENSFETSGGTAAGGRIHYHNHIVTTLHIVYRRGPVTDNPGELPFAAAQIFYIQADSASFGLDIQARTTVGNIYIINIDDLPVHDDANKRNIEFTTTNAAGFIEIRGNYFSTDFITLNSASVRFVDTGSVQEMNTPLFTVINGSVNATTGFNLTGNAVFTSANAVITSPHITMQNVTADGLTIANSGPYWQNGSVTASRHYRQTGAGSVFLESGVNISVTNPIKAGAEIRFASVINLSSNTVFSVPVSGGAVNLAQGFLGSHSLSLSGGSQLGAMDLNLAGNLDNIIITSASYAAVISNNHILQGNGSTLTLQGESSQGAGNGAHLDLSNGSWQIGGSPLSGNSFSGVEGILNLGTESRIIADSLNLLGESIPLSFTVNNSGRAFFSVRGDVVITDFVNLAGNASHYPNLVLEMIGNGPTLAQQVQTINSKQRLGSLHVRAGSRTDLTDDLEISGEVLIEYAASAGGISNGVLNAADNNIIMYAGLTEPKGRVSRWRILNTSSNIEAGGTDTPVAFLQDADKSVEFKKVNAADANVFIEIIGNTVWQNFICEASGAVIQFSTYPHQHVFLQSIEVKGSSASDRITLTRLPAVYNESGVLEQGGAGWSYYYNLASHGAPGSASAAGFGIPLFPDDPYLKTNAAERIKFWNFNIDNIPGLKIDNAVLYFSHAWSEPVIIETNVLFSPYFDGTHGYFNHNWRIERTFKIIYSFVEDANGNGKADRIRVQTSVLVQGNFTGFRVSVDGEEISGAGSFSVVSDVTGNPDDADSFYIKFTDRLYLYDGLPLSWKIIDNPALVDEKGGLIGKNDGTVFTTINTIPPRISYAVTLPNHGETFVQMSQPVARWNGSDAQVSGVSFAQIAGNPSVPDKVQRPRNTLIFLGDPDYPVEFTVKQGQPEQIGAFNFVFDNKGSQYQTPENLASLPSIGSAVSSNLSFEMKGLFSLSERALDWGGIDPSFPPPKYPVDWNYSGYLPFPGNYHITNIAADPYPVTNMFVPPYQVLTPQMVIDLQAGNSVTPASFLGGAEIIRRNTDVLVSRASPAAGEKNYFAWPVWARNSSNNSSAPGLANDPGTIWDFDGTKFLEPQGDIRLGALLNSNLGAVANDLTLYWSTDIAAIFRNPASGAQAGTSGGGLWMPDLQGLRESGYWYVPLAPMAYIQEAQLASGTETHSEYILSGDNLLVSGKKVEFVFGLPNIEDMIIARLDIPQGTSVPSDWYRRIRPFGFDIQEVRTQRGGVTILNNVINSDKRESTFLRYHLLRSGRVTIQVHTLDGTLVKSIRRNETREAGEWTDAWDGTNNAGRPVARGMYFIRIVAPDIDEIRKVMVVR